MKIITREEMDELWDNDPKKCEICEKNMPHIHWAILDGDFGKRIESFPVIKKEIRIAESRDDFVRWASNEELEEANKIFKERLVECLTKK